MTLSKVRSTPKADKELKQPRWKVRQKRRARARKRSFIIKELGGKCSSCGATEDLEVNHPFGGRIYKRGLACQSWSFIKAELSNVNLLCRSENAGFDPNVRV
jgi:hypothetical protein